MKELKKPTTINEQIDILLSRNLKIADIEFAKEVLSCVNYYNFTGYLFTYKDDQDCYHNITFEKAYNIYLCDKRLKSIVLYAIELIEHNLKTKLSYVLAHELGALCYTDQQYFNNASEHEIFMEKFNKAVMNNKSLLFVKHHIDVYNGQFPIWVAVELFTMGMMRNFYSNLLPQYKKLIAKKFRLGSDYLDSWITCISYLRNMAAHSMRLYRLHLPKTPRKSKYHNNTEASNKIFDIIYTMKYLAPQTPEWNNYIIPSIAQIFNEYSDCVTLFDYGFPEDWETLLKQ